MSFFPYKGDETAPETEGNSKSGMVATLACNGSVST